MEELLLDIGELEEIKKITSFQKWDFPVVYFGNSHVYFNKISDRFLAGNAVRWFASSEYIVGLPAKDNSNNAFTLRKNKTTGVTYTAFPSVLRKEKKLQDGHYKLLKYKDGFAFKRYEQITTE